MVDRKVGPKIHQITKLVIPPISQYVLPNGMRVCEVNLGSQEIVKMEVIHTAGRSVEDHRLISRATASLWKEGCGLSTSAQIAEKIDYFGSSIKSAANMDFAYTTLHTMTKHFDQLLPLVSEMYTDPTFPEDEIEKFKRLNIEKLKEELTKNESITYRLITEDFFGATHPYGYNSQESDYLDISRDKILDHHQKYIGSDNGYIFLSGKITDAIRNQVAEYFGKEQKTTQKKGFTSGSQQIKGSQKYITSQNEHQSAIKTGRKLFGKNHPDNAVFFLLNTIFGGYFGSRLMESIREDKGYTYDIFSSFDQMLHDGCFYISTEAAPEYVDPILKEIHHQMHVLQQEKVLKDELQMVKSYLMGNFMNMIDGPMNLSSFAKSMLLVGKQPEEFSLFVDEILSLNAADIVDAAQKYFDKDAFSQIIVSPK